MQNDSAEKTPTTAAQGLRDASRRHEEDIGQLSRLAMVGERVLDIAHELNQPLTAISNYAEACQSLLRSTDGSQEDVLGALREIDNEARRAGAIIRRLQGLAAEPKAR
jgi:two-component system, LuxR family, sensor kinase FixL